MYWDWKLNLFNGQHQLGSYQEIFCALGTHPKPILKVMVNYTLNHAFSQSGERFAIYHRNGTGLYVVICDDESHKYSMFMTILN